MAVVKHRPSGLDTDIAPHKLEGGKRIASSKNDAPLLTVVTVTFNAVDLIEDTITSVLKCASPGVEYIIVDGGSTDGTLDVIKKYEHAIDYWISEPDRGIYDAMNKAIGLAHGDFIININAGDRLLAIPLQALEDAGPDVQCVAARVALSNGTTFIPSNDWWIRVFNTLHHQGCFYRRTDQHIYDLSYGTFADFDLNQRMAISNATVAMSDQVVAYHSLDGISNNRKAFSEVYRIIKKNYGAPLVPFAMMMFKLKGLRARMRAIKW